MHLGHWGLIRRAWILFSTFSLSLYPLREITQHEIEFSACATVVFIELMWVCYRVPGSRCCGLHHCIKQTRDPFAPWLYRNNKLNNMHMSSTFRQILRHNDATHTLTDIWYSWHLQTIPTSTYSTYHHFFTPFTLLPLSLYSLSVILPLSSCIPFLSSFLLSPPTHSFFLRHVSLINDHACLLILSFILCPSRSSLLTLSSLPFISFSFLSPYFLFPPYSFLLLSSFFTLSYLLVLYFSFLLPYSLPYLFYPLFPLFLLSLFHTYSFLFLPLSLLSLSFSFSFRLLPISILQYTLSPFSF